MYGIYFEIEQRIRKPKFDNIEGNVIFTPLVSEPRPTRGQFCELNPANYTPTVRSQTYLQDPESNMGIFRRPEDGLPAIHVIEILRQGQELEVHDQVNHDNLQLVNR